MKIVQHGKKRKAISPVLATVILIAITLIAAIAVAGFVFGLFGSFTSSAQLSIQSSTVNCGAVAATVSICTMNVVNTGAGAASISGAGPATGSVVVALSPDTPVAIASNSATNLVTVTLTGVVTGQTVNGFLVVQSGANLGFTAQIP